jgi:hypothetical protein
MDNVMSTESEQDSKARGLWQRENAPHHTPLQAPNQSWESYRRQTEAQKTGH